MGDRRTKIQTFLRQGFVLPISSSSETMIPKNKLSASAITKETERNSTIEESDDNYFHSNPADSGRFTNHSSDPNMGPDGALRDIEPGEELTMDYSFHGNPIWYQTICAKYDVLTEAQIVEK